MPDYADLSRQIYIARGINDLSNQEVTNIIASLDVSRLLAVTR